MPGQGVCTPAGTLPPAPALGAQPGQTLLQAHGAKPEHPLLVPVTLAGAMATGTHNS